MELCEGGGELVLHRSADTGPLPSTGWRSTWEGALAFGEVRLAGELIRQRLFVSATDVRLHVDPTRRD